ncbi:IclR family transcriptional regulator C-terminal domain-containing protein [Pseudomonas sp. NPDC007930]|uniref:IclR family transcriptional regulator n=1 Tax=Pseudomonas sp. NPDC007930 TaxID=3364417 RepID=UPI0036E3E60C
MSEQERGGIQVISRAAAILRCLQDEPDGLSLGAIAKRIELPRSTVQRLVDALALEQLLEVQGAAGVRLGPALMRLASHSHMDVLSVARPQLQLLARLTGETVVLAQPAGLDILILQSEVSTQTLRVAPGDGSYLASYATSAGKVLLSRMSNEAVVALLDGKMRALTANTRSLAQLLAELETIRAENFSCDLEEQLAGVGAMAVGLDTRQGHYALSVVGPAWRIDAQRASLRQALEASAANIRAQCAQAGPA